jgi:hypothetical protein
MNEEKRTKIKREQSTRKGPCVTALFLSIYPSFPKDGFERKANYMVNVNELKNWVDITDEDDDEYDN